MCREHYLNLVIFPTSLSSQDPGKSLTHIRPSFLGPRGWVGWRVQSWRTGVNRKVEWRMVQLGVESGEWTYVMSSQSPWAWMWSVGFIFLKLLSVLPVGMLFFFHWRLANNIMLRHWVFHCLQIMILGKFHIFLDSHFLIWKTSATIEDKEHVHISFIKFSSIHSRYG